MQLGEVFFDKTLAKSPSAAPAPFSFSFSLVIVNVIHFLYQLEVNEVSMDRSICLYNCDLLFQLVCRPSGFTQNAMRYPPRSPDITIITQAKTRVQNKN